MRLLKVPKGATMNKTKIEWVKNPDGSQGYTWNSMTGCLNHVNGMCKGGNFPCYAYRLAHGRLMGRYLTNKNIARSAYPIPLRLDELPMDEDNPFYPRFWEDRLSELRLATQRNTKPKGIFVCDMSDLFGIGIPESWTSSVLNTIRETNNMRHRFYLLTKQPQNLIKFSPFPDNCWVGVTATNNAAMTIALTNLVNIEASVKYISFEPLLGAIGMNDHMSMKGVVDWLIIGAQTKPYKPPKIEWVREIVEAADKAGIPVFLKENLKPLLCSTINGHDVIESHNLWAFKYFKLRQELPKIASAKGEGS